MEKPANSSPVFFTQQVFLIGTYNEDGKENFVELITTPLYDKNNEIYAVVEIGHDITDHLKIQEELRKQRNILNHQAHHDALTDLPNRILFNDSEQIKYCVLIVKIIIILLQL